MKRIVDYLAENAKHIPGKTAVTAAGESLTYGTLKERVDAMAEQMKQSADRAVVVRSSQTVDFIVTYFAAHQAGKPIVPLEHDLPQATFDAIAQTVSKASIPGDVADVLFTTGTTGKRKGTMLSHLAISSNAENLCEAHLFSPELTFIIAGPLCHIGSLSKVWPSIMVGATIQIHDGLKDMDALLSAIENTSGKVATFLVPASIRMLLRFGSARLAKLAPKIDFLETGAAPMAQADMEELCSLLPTTRLYNTYASTETGILTTHDYNAGYCRAGCLGKPMKHARLKIGEDGTISSYGITIMSGYVGDPATTASVLRDGAVYTADRGELDEEGRLRLLGREGDVINVGGFKVNPVEVENAAMAFSDVADCICVAAPHPVLGTALQLIVVTEGGRPLQRKELALFLRSRLEQHKVPQIYSQADKICRTYNGKLDRKAYRQS